MNNRSRNLLAGLAFAATLVCGPVHAVTLYQTGGNGSGLYTTDSTNGATSFVGSFGYGATYALAFDPSNTLYAITNGFANGQLATVNPLTGAATLVGASTGVAVLMALVFASDGTGYAASAATNDLYKINTTTGALTTIGSLGFGGIMDLAFDSAGNLYGLSNALYEINTTTGAGSLVTNLANTGLMGLTIDPSGNFLATDYSTSNTPLYEINTSDGSLTSLGNTGVANAMALTYEGVAAVPEPETYAMMLAGLGLLGFLARRRKQKEAA